MTKNELNEFDRLSRKIYRVEKIDLEDLFEYEILKEYENGKVLKQRKGVNLDKLEKICLKINEIIDSLNEN